MAADITHISTWQSSLTQSGIAWQQDHLKVRLYPAASQGDDSSRPLIYHAPPELAPSHLCLYEWTDYRLRVDGAPGDPVVESGAMPVPRDPDGFFPVLFENRLGRSGIQVTVPGWPPLNVPLEILSPRKYPDPVSYVRFFKGLLTELSRAAVRLPFAIMGPTHMTVSERSAVASDLFAYHFLRAHADPLRCALARIAVDPHHRLVREDAWRPLTEASYLDGEVVAQLFAHADHWLPTPTATLALAQLLGGRAPEEVWQPVARESFDTPENRFVLAFVRTLQRQLDRIRRAPWWPQVPRASQDALTALATALQQYATLPAFAEVGELRAVPFASKVLLLRDGYRELAQLWRLFHVARAPFFRHLEEAIDLRDVPTLYEIWCFFRLVAELTAYFNIAPRCTVRVSDVQGLDYQTSACWPERATLVYNRTQRPPASYSLAVRPDFALLDAGGCLQVLFDAKFRFTGESWDPEVPDPIRRATREDLYTMHTYRDALGARTAVVLYPGDTAVAFDAVGRRRREGVGLKEVLTLEGIAAVPLEPGQET